MYFIDLLPARGLKYQVDEMKACSRDSITSIHLAGDCSETSFAVRPGSAWYSLMRMMGRPRVDARLSTTNFKYIREWYQFYELIDQQAVDQIIQQPVGQFPALLSLVPCGHHIQIMTKADHVEVALFYVKQTAVHNWSRNMLFTRWIPDVTNGKDRH